MKTIMYIVIFASIAYIPNFFQEKEEQIIIQEQPKNKVDSLIQVANAVEKRIDKGIIKKISNNNNELDSLKHIIKRQNIEIRKYKKMLKHDK